ncbi:MAG: acyl-CoA/acyl-ACP dehydrogenase [Microscillaceae bacterium]|jgi:acyl-CoA dehydrogenase|nr:acyl-CoA/acyl-ACP dehydrogenase [Microscillaceae bacterium]
MNFEFSQEQEFLREQARDFLTKKCSPAEVRKVLDNPSLSYHSELWQQVAELGWLGTTIPENYGGLGLGYLELCVLAEEIGRVVAPIPFSTTVYLATEAILLAANESQKAQYLPKLATGEILGTLAFAESAGKVSSDKIACAVQNGKISGSKIVVPDGDIAHLAVVAAKSENQQLSLYLVDLQQDSIKIEKQNTIDNSRSFAKITFNNAEAELLGELGQGAHLLAKILDRAAVLYAFEQVGNAQSALDMANEYAKKRYAFGRQIGSFQAIKHKLVDMFAQLELARSNAYYGAWALSTDAAELPLAAATARVSASQAGFICTADNIHIHGGNGATWEFNCHLYYRRAKLLALVIGNDQEWKDKIMDRLLADNQEVMQKKMLETA